MTNTQERPCSLITGGAGFIGSHVARHCLNMGHKVVALDDLSGGFADQVPAGADFVEGSVTDREQLARLFSQHKFDYVYHLAAYAAVGLSHYIRRFNYNVNLVGTVNLVNESVRAGIKCFVFTSSISVYGRLQAPLREDMPPRPDDPYGISKYAAELDLACAQEQFGLPSVIFRPHNVYGEHQNLGDPYRNVLGIFMNQLMKGAPLTVFGDGEQTRAFSHIDDVAPHIARCVNVPEAYNQVMNIGAEQPYSVNALAQTVMRELGKVSPIQHLPARNEVQEAYSSTERARRILGAEARVTLEEGVRRMAKWALRAGARSGKPFDNIELPDHLPPSWAALTGDAQTLRNAG